MVGNGETIRILVGRLNTLANGLLCYPTSENPDAGHLKPVVYLRRNTRIWATRLESPSVAAMDSSLLGVAERIQ